MRLALACCLLLGCAAPPRGGDPLLPLNAEVRRFIRYYQGPGRQAALETLGRAGRWLPLLARLLRSEGLPPELAWLAGVESCFDPRARSARGALGMWQFLRSTARLYGLRVDELVDERMDPCRSTLAAARYLRDLHRRFGNWHLALAAYNGGPSYLEALARPGESFWGLRGLRRQTREFVPKFIALALIGRDPLRFGFPLRSARPLRLTSVELSHPVSLPAVARACGLPLSRLREANPHLRFPCAPAGCALNLPPGAAAVLRRALPRLSGPLRGRRLAVYRIRPGDTLWGLARRYGVPLRLLWSLNGRPPARRLRPGRALVVPLWRVHRVAPGETLWEIARRHGVSLRALRRCNRLRGDLIRPGDRLRIPAP